MTTPGCVTDSIAVSGFGGTLTGLIKDCNTLLGLKGRTARHGEPELGSRSLDILVGTALPSTGPHRGVTELVRTGDQLRGSIPATLGNLTDLTHLDLSTNHFTTSKIPEELNDLTNLIVLSLHNCHDCSSSEIPYLGDLAQLTELYLHASAYTGGFPTWLGNLTKLTHLHLYGTAQPPRVGLTGEIPNLSTLTSLEELIIDVNGLTGPIPPSLGTLASLTRLDLDRNELTGTIPDLSKLTQLTALSLNTNQLTGSIPESLSALTSLEILSLHTNGLTGPIPESLGDLTRPDSAKPQ